MTCRDAAADDRVDLRSDTVTTPTPEMRAAMADAEVGDDVYGEDPTVNRLQSLAAALLGTEAALYVPSGTMANQLALRVLGAPGTEVLCADARARVPLRARGRAGEQRACRCARCLTPTAAPSTTSSTRSQAPRTTCPSSSLLVHREHATCRAAGAPIARRRDRRRSSRLAHAGGLAVHCDGARIWNAAIALGVSPAELVARCDTVMFCLSKGLGAPVGSLLCGPRRRDRRGARAPARVSAAGCARPA